MWTWIIAGAILLATGLYFGIGWVQTLGIGIIALPLIIIGLVVLIILSVVLLILLLGLVAVLKTGTKRKKARKD
jgi:hypothetical protein